MATYSRPISIDWGVPEVELYLTVQADAAGSTILRARASIGTTDATGKLLADVSGWDTDWRGIAIVDDGDGKSVASAFEPTVPTAAQQQANVQAALTAQGLTTARAAAIDTIESQTAAAQQQANATAALTAAGLDSTSVTNLKDAAAVAGAQATAAAAGVAAIAAGDTVVRARTHAGAAIARPDDVQVTVEGGVGGGDIPVQIDGVTRNGVGVDNCLVRAYLASDYEAGNLELRGQGVTGPDGKLVAPLMLNAGSYKVVVWDPQTRTSKTFDLEVAP